MTKLAIRDVTVFGGPAYIVNSEDGPATTCDYFVGVITTDGTEWQYPHGFRQEHVAETKLAARVRAAGMIDPAYWTKLEPRMSLEARLTLYAQREDEVRKGLRSEADMFHGIDP